MLLIFTELVHLTGLGVTCSVQVPDVDSEFLDTAAVAL
jgi:hypothetical protein